MSDQVPATTRQFRLTPAANPQSGNDDQLSTELDAIITIGRALSHIPDAETRARVMRWAIERFGIDVTPPDPPGDDLTLPAAVIPAVISDVPAPETLNVEGLNELFPDPAEPSRDARDLPWPPSRNHREGRRQKPTVAERLRHALHWMGI